MSMHVQRGCAIVKAAVGNTGPARPGGRGDYGEESAYMKAQ
jgi:hypothetical protein